MFLTDCPVSQMTVPWVSSCLPDEIECALPDLDQDGDVDINDFIDLLDLWGVADCQVFKRGDINQDGMVGIMDLLILLAAFGTYDPAIWDRCDC